MNYHHNPMNTYAYPFHPENDINSTSTLQHEDPFSFTFPNSPQIMSHLEYNYSDDDHDLQFLDLFCQHQSLNTTSAHKEEIINTTLLVDNMPPEYSNHDDEEEEEIHHDQLPSSITTVVTISKKKKKKDRHSKIETARGPRDRRMRLSLEVARKFFDLQDLLGYDKASSTVEWLLRNSASAITDLSDNYYLIMIGGANSTTTATSSINTLEDQEVVSSSKKEKKHPQPKKTTKKIRSTVTKESRRKARERARERTSQKRRLVSSAQNTLPIIVETPEQDLSSVYQNNIAVFPHQNEQIAEFQFCTWEAYNNSSSNLSG